MHPHVASLPEVLLMWFPMWVGQFSKLVIKTDALSTKYFLVPIEGRLRSDTSHASSTYGSIV